MKKWTLMGGAVLVVVIVAVWIMSPSEEAAPPEIEKPTGPDPALVSKVEGLVRQAEEFEAQGRFDEALSALDELARLKTSDPRPGTLRPRIGEKKIRFETWRRARGQAEEAREKASRSDAPADWQKVVDFCAEAGKNAATEEQLEVIRDLESPALQRRDWSAAREAEKKGDLAAALDLVAKAIAVREAPEELATYKADLERKKRKREFDETAAAARAEGSPVKALELWRRALPLAEAPADVEEAKRQIDLIAPRVDPAERDRRFDAAMKAGEEAFSKGDLDDAEKGFRDAKALKAADVNAAASLARVEAARRKLVFEAAMAEADGAEKRKGWSEAIAALERALKTKPGDPAATRRLKALTEEHRPARIVLVIDAPTGLKLELVRIPKGTYRIGDARGGTDEKPRDVVFEKDFWMQATEATHGQWQALMQTKPFAFGGTSDMPAENVSWLEIHEFLVALNARVADQLKGRTLALPTEAEWETACRAGAKTRWSFGDNGEALGEHAWFTRNATKGPRRTGQKPPNAWGLHDMEGNVAEWCEDLYSSDPEKPLKEDPDDETPRPRSIRGGSWNDGAEACRPSRRARNLPDKGTLFTGFRVVLR